LILDLTHLSLLPQFPGKIRLTSKVVKSDTITLSGLSPKTLCLQQQFASINIDQSEEEYEDMIFKQTQSWCAMFSFM
jgi:hypothetical protein